MPWLAALSVETVGCTLNEKVLLGPEPWLAGLTVGLRLTASSAGPLAELVAQQASGLSGGGGGTDRGAKCAGTTTAPGGGCTGAGALLLSASAPPALPSGLLPSIWTRLVVVKTEDTADEQALLRLSRSRQNLAAAAEQHSRSNARCCKRHRR